MSHIPRSLKGRLLTVAADPMIRMVGDMVVIDAVAARDALAAVEEAEDFEDDDDDDVASLDDDDDDLS